MSVVVNKKVENDTRRERGKGPEFRSVGHYVLTKGAPEVVTSLCTPLSVPDWYTAELGKAEGSGFRVLALAYRRLEHQHDMGVSLRTLSRTDAECGLTFAGLLIADAPLKDGTKETLGVLRDARIRLVMATGDALLTAVAVARSSGILPPYQASERRDADFVVVLDSLHTDENGKQTAIFVPISRVKRRIAEQPADAPADTWTAMEPGSPVSSRPVSPTPSDSFTVEISTSDTYAVVLDISRQYTLCAQGTKLSTLLSTPYSKLAAIVAPRLRVLARCSPDAKSSFVSILETSGIPTLMCGDGTNDVGALRTASVGVALRETVDYALVKKQKAEHKRLGLKPRSMMGVTLPLTPQQIAQAQARDRRNNPGGTGQSQQPEGGPGSTAWRPSVMGTGGMRATQMQLYEEARVRSSERGTKVSIELAHLIKEQQRWSVIMAGRPDPGENYASPTSGMNVSLDDPRAQALLPLLSQLSPALLEGMVGDTNEDTPEKIAGDASLAAPFTAKSGTISGVTKILRQGRCTLVSALSTYKTVGVSSITLAYYLSVLTLDGVRSSDKQMIALNVLTSALSITGSVAKPVKALSPRPPASRVTGVYSLVSMFGQVVVHLVTFAITNILRASVKTELGLVGEQGSGDETVPFDTKFRPSMTNTIVFYIDAAMQITTTAVNYPGEPHVRGVKSYKALRRSITFAYIGLIAILLQIVPDINNTLGLLIMPRHLVFKILALIIFNTAGAWGIEMFAREYLTPRPLDPLDV